MIDFFSYFIAGPAGPSESSTPSPVTTAPAPAVTVAPGCLPLYPSNDPDINKESGDRFGKCCLIFIHEEEFVFENLFYIIFHRNYSKQFRNLRV